MLEQQSKGYQPLTEDGIALNEVCVAAQFFYTFSSNVRHVFCSIKTKAMLQNFDL